MEARAVGTREPDGEATASFEHVVLILRSRETVFGSLATLQYLPRWSLATEDDEGGSFEVIGYEPPERLTLAGHIGSFEAVVDHRLDELALGTLVTCRTDADLCDALPADGVWFATSRIEAAVSWSLERAKQILEAEEGA